MISSYQILRCHTTLEIRNSVAYLLEQYSELLPSKKDAVIFIKSNCNSDMSGLTGNTTDLRVLVALVVALRKRGYKNIIVGDGTSSGFINARIDVLSRLRLRALSKVLGFAVIYLNKASAVKLQMGNQWVKIAQISLVEVSLGSWGFCLQAKILFF